MIELRGNTLLLFTKGLAMYAPETITVSACERCLQSVECKILNSYRCGNGYAPAPGSVFELMLDTLTPTGLTGDWPD